MLAQDFARQHKTPRVEAFNCLVWVGWQGRFSSPGEAAGNLLLSTALIYKTTR
jgi:hypothetical protein